VRTLWVEVLTPSQKLRDIQFRLYCNRQSDTASATALWFTSQIITETLTGGQLDATLGADWVEHGGDVRSAVVQSLGRDGTGLASGGTQYDDVVDQFTVMPSLQGVSPIDVPTFEVDQRSTGYSGQWENDGKTIVPYLEQVRMPEQNEAPDSWANIQNEQGHTFGGFVADSTLSPGGHLWCATVVGFSGRSDVLDAVRANMQDYVRVAFDNRAPNKEGTEGSRCSDVNSWYCQNTLGLATTPDALGLGSMTFRSEALATYVRSAATTPGTLQHADMLGFFAAKSAGQATQPIAADLLISRGGEGVKPAWVKADTSRSKDAQTAGQSAATQVGDLLAYSTVGYFASTMDGDIVTPLSWKNPGALTSPVVFTQTLGSSTAPEPSIQVTGTPAAQPSLDLPTTLAFGQITPAKIHDGFVPAADPSALPSALSAGGVQPISVDIVTVNSYGGRGALLARDENDEVTIAMRDQVTGALTSAIDPIWVIPTAAMAFSLSGWNTARPLPVPSGPNSVPAPTSTAAGELDLGGDMNGDILGPMGSAGTSASLAWTFANAGLTTAPPITVNGPVTYEKYLASQVPTDPVSAPPIVIPRGPAGVAGIPVAGSVAAIVYKPANSSTLALPSVQVSLHAIPNTAAGLVVHAGDILLDRTKYSASTPPAEAFPKVALLLPPPPTAGALAPLLHNSVPIASKELGEMRGNIGSTTGGHSVYWLSARSADADLSHTIGCGIG
jgi:hypothetical protein